MKEKAKLSASAKTVGDFSYAHDKTGISEDADESLKAARDLNRKYQEAAARQ